MKKAINRLAALLLIAALVLALSACGGEKKDQPAAETPAPTAEATPASPTDNPTPPPEVTLVESTEEAGAADGTASGDGADLG